MYYKCPVVSTYKMSQLTELTGPVQTAYVQFGVQQTAYNTQTSPQTEHVQLAQENTESRIIKLTQIV